MSAAAHHTLLTAGGRGFLSAEVFTSLLLMSEDALRGERGGKTTRYFHSTIFPDCKIQFLTGALFEQFASKPGDGKHFFFLSDGEKGKQWHYHHVRLMLEAHGAPKAVSREQ